MKRLFLAFLLATAALVQAGDHIELGSLITKSGVRVSVVYLVLNDTYTEAHLVFPGGKKIQVTVQPGTSAKALDKALQQIADEQKP